MVLGSEMGVGLSYVETEDFSHTLVTPWKDTASLEAYQQVAQRRC